MQLYEGYSRGVCSACRRTSSFLDWSGRCPACVASGKFTPGPRPWPWIVVAAVLVYWLIAWFKGV